METTIYIAKQNLPGDVLKDDKIELINGNYFSKRTSQSVPYKCADEPKFFKLHVEVVRPFKVSDIVFAKSPVVCKIVKVVHTKYDRTRNTSTVIPYTAMTVTEDRGRDYVVKIENGNTLIIDEKHLVRAQFYYYWNSSGTLCREVVGRYNNAEMFRKSIGNYFDSDVENTSKAWLTANKDRAAKLKS